MQNVGKRSIAVAGNLANLSLLHQRVVEEICRILLLFGVLLARHVLAILLLLPLRRSAGNVEAHLDELIARASGLLPPRSGASEMAVGARVLSVRRQRELYGHLVLSGQVRVRYLRVGDLESGATLDVERHLGLAKLGLAPIPPAESMFLVLEIDAVPQLERLAETIKVLESVRDAPDQIAVLPLAGTRQAV